MVSDIGELLERMRSDEQHLREKIQWEKIYGDRPVRFVLSRWRRDADCLARYIAAAEELRDSQAGTVTLAPTVGLQPIAILDPPEPLRRNRTRPIEETNDGK